MLKKIALGLIVLSLAVWVWYKIGISQSSQKTAYHQCLDTNITKTKKEHVYLPITGEWIIYTTGANNMREDTAGYLHIADKDRRGFVHKTHWGIDTYHSYKEVQEKIVEQWYTHIYTIGVQAVFADVYYRDWNMFLDIPFDEVLSLPVDGDSFQQYDDKKVTKQCPTWEKVLNENLNRCFAEDKNYIYARKADEELHYVIMRIRKK